MITFFGKTVQNFITAIKYIATGKMRLQHVITQAVEISYDSLPIALIISVIAAAVITIQVSKQFLMSGADTYIGGTLVVVIVREIAPAFVALSIGARAGTAISAEIANMQVTEQVDAIKTLKVDPIGYYFAPRLVAAGLTVPMVTIIAELVAILGGMFVAYLTIGLHPNRYMNSVWLWLNTRDFYISIFKAFCFGIIIANVCATQGYETKGGAKDVGISTTQAAIKSTIYLLIADFLINFLFYL